MAKKVNNKKDDFQSVEQALSKSEAFIEKYQKHLLIGVGIAVAVVLIVLAVRNLYIKPREVTAENEMYKAQLYFATDSFNLALHGDGINFIGFKEIASEYSVTPSGNLAVAYVGICYYKMEDYQNAIKYLSQFDGDDTYLTTSVIGLIGDSYIELNDVSKAVSYFEKAGGLKNEVLSPIYLKKAGLAYETLNQPEKAEKCYITIKESYPTSQEARDIEKYMARISK